MFMLDKDMQILRVIANSSSQTISHEHIFLEAKKTSSMEEDQVEESLKTLELNGLVGRRGICIIRRLKGA
ncbi:MAG: hypothetical protein QMD80_07360 [archaeon]|nr:hypothetical protein [archaeon]